MGLLHKAKKASGDERASLLERLLTLVKGITAAPTFLDELLPLVLELRDEDSRAFVAQVHAPNEHPAVWGCGSFELSALQRKGSSLPSFITGAALTRGSRGQFVEESCRRRRSLLPSGAAALLDLAQDDSPQVLLPMASWPCDHPQLHGLRTPQARGAQPDLKRGGKPLTGLTSLHGRPSP